MKERLCRNKESMHGLKLSGLWWKELSCLCSTEAENVSTTVGGHLWEMEDGTCSSSSVQAMDAGGWSKQGAK